MEQFDDLKLKTISIIINEYLSSRAEMLVSTQNLLKQILDITDGKTFMQESIRLVAPKIIISCDASIKVNPGGPAAVGVVINYPGELPLQIAKVVPANTNNEAEYDAIYEGLLALSNLKNRPDYDIVVMSDSQLVIKQLLGEYKVNSEILQRKKDSINELAHSIPANIEIQWRPRNSTLELTIANNIAQTAIGVPNH